MATRHPKYVVDTSVAFRWFVEQVGFEHAREILKEFLDGSVELATPDMSRVELGHVMRKAGFLRGLLTRQEVIDGVVLMDELGVQILRTEADHLQQAAALAVDHSRPMFDSIFVVHAIEQDLPLLTADARLARQVAGTVEVEVLRGITL